MHPALKKGTKNFHSTSNSCGIFVIAFFHGTKIPTVDMKVLVYSNFSQKNSKKMKSPSSMRNERFHTPKCRGKLQKMVVLYTHPPKKPKFLLHARAYKKILKNNWHQFYFLNAKKLQVGGATCNYRLHPVADRRSPGLGQPVVIDRRLGRGLPPATASRCLLLCKSPFILPLPPPSYLMPTNFCTCGQLFLIGSSTCLPCLDFS
jgi:hypothetical protein